MSCGGRSFLRLIAAVLLALSLFSCSRDPNVVKRRFLEGGNKYFQKGQYSQARIMYLSALKADAKYGEAYYRLALSEIKLASIDKTLIALRRAVELLPEGPDSTATATTSTARTASRVHGRFTGTAPGTPPAWIGPRERPS